MAGHVLDALEVGCRRLRIVEEAQRDPSRHEMAFDARVFLGRLGPLRDHAVGREGVAEIEQLARHDPALDPPLLAIIDLGEVAGRGQQHLRGLGDLVLVPQKVRVQEQIAGVLARVRRHGVEQFPDIAGLAVERDVRLRDRDVAGTEPARGPHRRLVVAGEQPLLHARLVIGAAQELRITIERLLLDLGRERVVAPRLANERLGGFLVALRDERARQHQPPRPRLGRRSL